MSYLDKLLEGVKVEWKTLEEVCEFKNGKGHERDINQEGGFIVVNSKFISTDGRVAKYSHKQICPLYSDDILIVMSDLPNGKALAKTFIVDEDDRYTLNQRIGSITIKNKSELFPKYFNYYLNRTQQLLKYNNGIDQTNLRKKQILDVKIPIPPLKTQKEIVRVLDSFIELSTELTAELTTELIARKKQYSYYREQLLCFNESEVEWKTLGEVGKFTYGYAAKAKDIGNARFVRISDIDINGKLKAEGKKYVDVSDENSKYILAKNDLLMARTGATYGKTMIFEEDYSAIYAGFLIKLRLDNSLINPKYYWHFAQSNLFWDQAKKLMSGGGQPQFNANVLKLVKLPIPYPHDPQKSLEVQNELINTLNKFDTLTTSISEGLLKEIELRKKQYEYYRNKLLTFPKDTVEA